MEPASERTSLDTVLRPLGFGANVSVAHTNVPDGTLATGTGLGKTATTAGPGEEVIRNEVAGSGEVGCIVSTNLDRKEDSDVNR